MVQLNVGRDGVATAEPDLTPLPPGTQLRVLFVYPNVQRVWTFQIGIGILSSCLKQMGAETQLFDTTETPRGEESAPFRAILDDYQPDLIAYSIRSNEWTLTQELLTIGRARRIPQILGGPHATHAPEDCIPFADAIVIGEGEGAMADIARALASGEPLAGIANTWVNTQRGVVKTPKRDLIRDLDTLPFPDWRLFDEVHYKKSFIRDIMGGNLEVVAAIEGSRGCPFTCTYCSNSTLMEDYKGQGRWRREKSPERMVEELEAFRREFGRLDFVYWVDEIWLTGLDRLKAFRDLYKPRVGVPFSIMERPECITEEKIAVIADAGLHFVAIGLESGDEELRAGLLNRRTSIEILRQAFTLRKKYKIKVHAFTMVGLPGQDEASMMKTWRFMREVMPTSAQFSYFFPLKGTKLHDQSVDMGIYTPGEMIESYHAGSVLDQEDVIGHDVLTRYHDLFNKYVTRQGVGGALAFHLGRKNRLAYWWFIKASPVLIAQWRRGVNRFGNLLRCTPREAIRKIVANAVDLFAIVNPFASGTSVSRKP
ncbi:MAG: B12-binding domain-containing radical SAM protein [Planctomycetes bacterium]|nr:B12-binding domain-containing radical SAM protein [Planctomycetota bacterium]